MKQKVMSFLLIIVLVFSNFFVAKAASDVTPPEVKDMTWSATELYQGDNLEITLDASDVESGISTNSYDNVIYISNNISKQTKAAYFNYDEQSNKYKATFNITSDMPSGEWDLDYIILKDKSGNQKFYNESDFGKHYMVNIITSSKDVTPPVINDMTWSATELYQGDNLVITLDASDAESGISTNSYDNVIYISNNISKQTKAAYFNYDEQNGKYKATFIITSDMPSGEWDLDYIILKDKSGNQKFYSESDFSKHYMVNIITSSKDVTPPVVKDMTWSATELYQGENLDITLDASDVESGISTNSYDNVIYIINKKSKQSKSVYLNFDEQNDKYKATFNIMSNMPSGEWDLDYIILKDKSGNQKIYYESDFGKEFKVNIKSVFSGTDNLSIPQGKGFNPLDGVKAESPLEGDFTDKITYSGNADTSTQGVYLIKYEAIGKNGNVYKDYRWITIVKEVTEESSDVYFNNAIKINTSNLFSHSSISITKDGVSYNLDSNNSISEEGKYLISFKDLNSNIDNTLSSKLNINTTKGLMSTSATLQDSQTSEIMPSSLEFTIDKTSPVIQAIYSQSIVEGDSITADKLVLANDNYNEIKYDFETQPLWDKVGNQIVKVVLKDLAGNVTKQDVNITILDKCDIDKDGNVSILDLANEAKCYNNRSSSIDWNSKYDFNKDNTIDIFDLVILSRRLK